MISPGPLNWQQARTLQELREASREALERAKAFAESWSAIQFPEVFGMQAPDGIVTLRRDDLNRVIALAEQAVDDYDNPPRGGH